MQEFNSTYRSADRYWGRLLLKWPPNRQLRASDFNRFWKHEDELAVALAGVKEQTHPDVVAATAKFTEFVAKFEAIVESTGSQGVGQEVMADVLLEDKGLSNPRAIGIAKRILEEMGAGKIHRMLLHADIRHHNTLSEEYDVFQVEVAAEDARGKIWRRIYAIRKYTRGGRFVNEWFGSVALSERMARENINK